MEVNPKDPRHLGAALLVIAGTLGAGSMLGFTIEPEETTELRVLNATMTERAANLDAQVEGLEQRIEVLEDIAEDCRKLLTEREQP